MYTHMEFPEIFVPQRRQHEAGVADTVAMCGRIALLPGGSGRLGSEEGRRSKAGTWRLNQLNLYFINFHDISLKYLSQQNASHRVYSQNGQKMLEVNTTFPPLLVEHVEQIGCRDCSAFVLCVSLSFASLKSCRRIQVESASWSGPGDHAGRVQVQAVPPHSLHQQGSKRFISKAASDTALWYRYTSAFATCSSFTTGFKRLMRSNSRYFQMQYLFFLFWAKWYQH